MSICVSHLFEPLWLTGTAAHILPLLIRLLEVWPAFTGTESSFAALWLRAGVLVCTHTCRRHLGGLKHQRVSNWLKPPSMSGLQGRLGVKLTASWPHHSLKWLVVELVLCWHCGGLCDLARLVSWMLHNWASMLCAGLHEDFWSCYWKLSTC